MSQLTRQGRPALRAMTCSLLAIGAALVVVACGNDDEKSPAADAKPPAADQKAPPAGAARTVSKAELVSRGDAICRRHDARLTFGSATLVRREGGAESIARIAPILRFSANTIRSEAAEIVALGTPSADAGLLDRYLNQRTTAGNGLRSAAQAAQRNDLKTFEAALVQVRQNETEKLAKRFGFKVCAQRQMLFSRRAS